MLRRLLNVGSESADIATRLDLTRGVVRAAMDFLRNGRKVQVNLAGVRTATRLKTLTAGGVVPTKCPKKLCVTPDSFRHVLECYNLGQGTARGSAAAPLLVIMARAAPIGGRINPVLRSLPSPQSVQAQEETAAPVYTTNHRCFQLQRGAGYETQDTDVATASRRQMGCGAVAPSSHTGGQT